MAMLLRSLRARVIARGARNFRAYAELAVGHEERTWSLERHGEPRLRAPAGPAVVITPWNAPFMLATWKIAPALAAGCTVVLKPAEWSPLSCSLLADLADEAELAAGRPQRRAGDRRGGRRRARLRPARAPHLVHRLARDRPPDRRGRGAQPGAVHRRARRQGAASSSSPTPTSRPPPARPRASTTTPGRSASPARACSSRRRSPTSSSSSSTRFADEHVLGDPRDDATTVSPLIHREHLARVEGFVERAREAGDEIVRGGRRRRARRALLRADARAAALERERDRAARGLRAGADLPALRRRGGGGRARQLDPLRPLRRSCSRGSAERAERVGRALRAGTVWVNTFLVRDLTAPFGGVGISGLGREGGDYALDFYSDLETLQIKEGTGGPRRSPQWRGAGQSSWATAKGRTRRRRRGGALPRGCATRSPARAGHSPSRSARSRSIPRTPSRGSGSRRRSWRATSA